MSQYTVTVWEIHKAPQPNYKLSQHGPFFIADKAKREAIRLSRETHSPDVIVMLETDEQRRGYPKLYRMGRLHRQ